LTLQFLMDQLRADLAPLGWHKLPGGWQFVHIDVPTSADGTGPGIPPTVRQNGGRYVHVSSDAATYPEIARVVEGRLAEGGALGTLATWRPDPQKVNVPVHQGAGQFRAVGRMLTLSKLDQIRTQLEDAWKDLQDTTARQELRAIAQRVSPSTVQQDADPPIVIVVSSMAGGSGASMALDVCRLLGTISGVPRDALLFVYTAEVFYRIEPDKRAGVEANAAAMIGELMAAQTGAGAAGDRAIFAALGQDIGPGSDIPFRRVIPIGAKIGGDGAIFGDGSSVGVFRGVGRGLAALMLSGVAMKRFQKATVENFAGSAVRQAALGWGVAPDSLLWGSFGFASVGLGRDRYAEYAAQRLARLAVDRLVDGHLDPADSAPAEEQIRRRVELEWPAFAAVIGLPATAAELRPWFLGLVEANNAARKAEAFVQDTIGRRAAGQTELDLPRWLQLLAGAAIDFRADINKRIEEDAYAWAFRWQKDIRQAMQGQLRRVIAEHGLATARRLLDQLLDLSEGWVVSLTTASRTAPDVTALSADFQQRLGGVKGRVPFGSGQVRSILDRYCGNAKDSLGGRMAALLSEILASMATGYIRPLQSACDDGLVMLERARQQRPAQQGQALLRTAEYQAWPSGQGRVPPRFSEAQNEVFLTRAEGYEEAFRQHVLASVGATAFESSARSLVSMIVAGEWTTTGGEQTDHPSFEPRAEWWPPTLRKDLDNPGGPDRAERGGHYRMLLSAESMLERARSYVGRPNEPFHRFVSQSLYTFLTDGTVTPSVLQDRAGDLERAFQVALELSRPLAALNAQSVQHVHGRQPTTYHSFNEISFGSLHVAQRLRQSLRNDGIDTGTLDAFDDAVETGDQSSATRIDIFGRYPYLSPIVYTSLLEPLAKTWLAAGASQRGVFWQWRRARRLPGGLPMGEADRHAMIAGYFLGRVFGLVEVPTRGRARVFDLQAPSPTGQRVGAWVDFPDPLLTPLTAARHPLDKIACLLESIVVAMAACHNRPDLSPLQPYVALRVIYDDGDAPAVTAEGTAAARLTAAWIQQARPPVPPGRSGAAAIVADFAPTATLFGSSADTAARRKELLLAQVASWREGVGTGFLPRGYGGAAGGGEWSRIDYVEQLGAVPLFHEIAEDAYAVLKALEVLIEGTPLEAVVGDDTRFKGLE
jgi:hypothetical protein